MEQARPYQLRFAAAAALAVALCVGLLLHALHTRPELAWLESDATAPWIEYPLPARLESRPALELSADFTRDFELAAVPARAELRARGFRSFEVWLNGVRVLPQAQIADDSASWKVWQRAEVAGALRSGANRVVARAANATGPPALALSLSGDGLDLASGASWRAELAGASERPARLAGMRARPAAELAPEEGGSALASLRASRGFLCLAGLGALALSIGIHALARSPARAWLARAAAPLAVAAGVWTALFLHDAPRLPLELGFDVRGHLDYLRYLIERHSLPSGHEGWQMYQPPLFYVIASGWLGATGAELHSAQGAWALRALMLGFGLAQLVLLYAGVRSLWPQQPALPALGLLFAAALPMQTTLFQLVGNETLAMPLVSATSLLALVALRRGESRLARWGGIGAALGLAALAKFSAALLLPPLLASLALRNGLRLRALAAALPAAAALLLGAAVVCGWHYARVWALYGTPFAANWDPALGFRWWQDPGYRVASDYLRGLSSAIADPWWAAFTSVPGGLYSTSFGDGLLSGQRALIFGAPWDHRLLACAGVLALFPCALLCVGAVRAVPRAAREPGWLFLWLLALTTALALLAMPLRVPAYSLVKAHFGHAALLPACAFLALGCEPWLQRRAFAVPLTSLLLLWAAVSLGGVWIPEHAARSAAAHGFHALSRRDPAGALVSFEEALRRDPSDAQIAAGAFEALRVLHRGDESLALCESPRSGPGAARLLVACAREHQARGDRARAEQELAHARELDPDEARAPAALAQLYLRSGRSPEATAALREVLRIRPHELSAHLDLAKLALAGGALERAAAHLELALALDPGNRRAETLRAALRAATADASR